MKAIRTHTHFMSIMRDYMERQNDDPNFDPRQALHDLYADLCDLYHETLKP